MLRRVRDSRRLPGLDGERKRLRAEGFQLGEGWAPRQHEWHRGCASAGTKAGTKAETETRASPSPAAATAAARAAAAAATAAAGRDVCAIGVGANQGDRG